MVFRIEITQRVFEGQPLFVIAQDILALGRVADRFITRFWRWKFVGNALENGVLEIHGGSNQCCGFQYRNYDIE